MQMNVYLLPSPTSPRPLRAYEDFRWIRPAEFDRFAFSAAQRKIVEMVLAKTDD